MTVNSEYDSDGKDGRLAALELQVERGRRVVGVMVVVLSAILLTAFAAPKSTSVQTDKLELVDRDGVVRTRLQMLNDADGLSTPVFEFLDSSGQRVAMLRGSERGAALELTSLSAGPEGDLAHAVELGVGEDGPWLSLVDSGVPRFDVNVRHASPSLFLSNGVSRLKLGVRPGFLGRDKERMGLFLEDGETNLRGSLVMDPARGVELTVIDGQGGIVERLAELR